MNALHPAFLLLLLIPSAWMFWSWRRVQRPLSLVLKTLTFAAIILALAEISVTMPETKTGVVFLADTSGSITDDDLARASSYIAEASANRGRNWMTVLPFAHRMSQAGEADRINGPLRLVHTGGDDQNGTNFEAALRDSVAALPAEHLPRVVLISDGLENEGSSARALAELERLNIPVDTVPLHGRANSGLQLVSLGLPREAYAGEELPVTLMVQSPRSGSGTLELTAEGKAIGSSAVDLRPGSNEILAHARLKTSGAVALTGKLAVRGMGELPFGGAVSIRRAKLLFLSEDAPEVDVNLTQALDQAGFELVRDRGLIDRGLEDTQVVVLNNLDLTTFASRQKKELEQFVRRGGGLLLIGGERQIYKDDKQMDALDRALPAKLAPPKTPEGICVALIVDKSSSMEGRKIELARLSASGVVDHLRPIDTIGILIFDNSFQWAVPVRRAQDKQLIKRLISGITPDGGTQIAPALTEAYRKIVTAKGTYKHIVLLTDGISEEGDSMDLAREAAQHEVTISTVGLGQDVNRTYLERVAATSGGRSYFLNEPQGLEQILLKDVQEYTGSTAVERPLLPIVRKSAEVLEGVSMETAPALKGYARYEAKLSGDTVLGIDAQKKDPLYVRWQYGLGRAAVFASDAKSRWAADWVAWPGFDKFWINVTRDLLTHTERSEARAQFDTADGDIMVTYTLGPGVTDPSELPELFALGPNGFRKPVNLRRTAPRTYMGRVHAGRLTGLFRVRPVRESSAFPEVGLYREQPEFQDAGVDAQTLRQISTLTGGRFNPAASSVFDAGGRSLSTSWQLWPGFVGLAIALSLAELVLRKWSGLAHRFGR